VTEKKRVAMLAVDADIARVILGMSDVCQSEGIGPDDTVFLDFIREHFPELAVEYEYLYSRAVYQPVKQTPHVIDPGYDTPPVLAYPELFVYSEESKKYYQAKESLCAEWPDGTKSIKGKITNVRDTITCVYVFENGDILDSRTIKPISLFGGDILNIDIPSKTDREDLK